jgi:hypothetical protein
MAFIPIDNGPCGTDVGVLLHKRAQGLQCAFFQVGVWIEEQDPVSVCPFKGLVAGNTEANVLGVDEKVTSTVQFGLEEVHLLSGFTVVHYPDFYFFLLLRRKKRADCPDCAMSRVVVDYYG